MALSHSLGFPRIGRDRELKKALETHWKGELDEAGLRAVGQRLRAEHWQLQKDAGIDLLPVGDFAWYDQVLGHSLAFGVIPERFRPADAPRLFADASKLRALGWEPRVELESVLGELWAEARAAAV